VLPPGVSQLLDATFEVAPKHGHSIRALVSAGIVSFLGASNVIATLMEGLRRADELPANCWSFWQRRRRTFELVPLSLVPLAVFSVLVMFGHAVTEWLTFNLGPEVRGPIDATSLLIRWVVALGASVGLIALIYFLGVPDGPSRGRRAEGAGSTTAVRRWRSVLPGAVIATAMWFLTTLGFGWYVTRFANYSEVYGSLGAVIALLFWLYIVSLSVLCGAEFNAQFARTFQRSGGQEIARMNGRVAAEESAQDEGVAK
jgi:membrane protein